MNNSAAQAIFAEKLAIAFPQHQGLRMPADDASIGEVWRAISSQLELSQQSIAKELADAAHISLAGDLAEVDKGLLAKLPQATAQRSCVLPIKLENGNVYVACANPFDLNLQQDLQFIFGMPITPRLAPPEILESSIASLYEELDVEAAGQKSREHKKQLDEREIPKLASELVNRAIRMKASDIHIQPVTGGDAVRMRVDGVLRRLVIMPQAVGDSVVRYFKAQSKMDPTNVNVPQDGRMDWELGERKFDLRVSTLPVAGHHEKLVIRILSRNKSVTLHESGLSLVEIHTLRRMASQPSGVILLCGPTGSGKTTTLYSVLSEVNEEGTSIATVENPVEYQMSGLAQTEVNAQAGMTFAAALRSILRQDPDIILIGEIRDSETAEIAMQSALTGHLVFSTLHTNAAVTAIPRLMDLGIAPPVLSEALTGIVSQRLLRRLCPECKQEIKEAEAPEDMQFHRISKVLPGARAVGCEQCNFTGYKGRLAVTEIIELNNEMVRLIAEGESSSKKLLAACGETYSPLTITAVRRIMSGDTSVAEAYRVLGKRFWMDLATEYDSDMPDLASLSVSRAGQSASRPGVLLAGPEAAFDKSFCSELESAWFRPFLANSPDQAKELLHANDDMEFIILDLPADLSDQEVLKYVAEYRVAVAWSQLPALLLLPSDNQGWEQLLSEHGASSQFMTRSAPVSEISERIHDAMAANLDYRWGAK